MRRMIRIIAVLAVAAFCVSCLPVPLGDPAKSTVDPTLKGVWLMEGEKYVIVVAPLDAHTYCIELVQVVRDGNGAMKRGRSDAARGWLTEVKGLQFITLEPIVHMADRSLPRVDHDSRYAVLKLTRGRGTVIFEPIVTSDSLISGVKTPAELRELISERDADHSMYGGPTSLRRLHADMAADRPYLDLLSNPWMEVVQVMTD